LIGEKNSSKREVIGKGSRGIFSYREKKGKKKGLLNRKGSYSVRKQIEKKEKGGGGFCYLLERKKGSADYYEIKGREF